MMDEGFARRWIQPFYLHVLHGNFVRYALEDTETWRAFLRSTHDAAATVGPDILQTLLDGEDWRSRMAGAWLVGVTRAQAFRDPIGQRLVETRFGFVNEGYAFALARLGGRDSLAWLLESLAVGERLEQWEWHEVGMCLAAVRVLGEELGELALSDVLQSASGSLRDWWREVGEPTYVGRLAAMLDIVGREFDGPSDAMRSGHL